MQSRSEHAGLGNVSGIASRECPGTRPPAEWATKAERIDDTVARRYADDLVQARLLDPEIHQRDATLVARRGPSYLPRGLGGPPEVGRRGDEGDQRLRFHEGRDQIPEPGSRERARHHGDG